MRDGAAAVVFSGDCDLVAGEDVGEYKNARTSVWPNSKYEITGRSYCVAGKRFIKLPLMKKVPLMRRVNTTAHRPNVRCGGQYRTERNTKAVTESDAMRLPMHAKAHKGRSYVPLFKFLLSKVGQPWSQVHSEAVSRLDKSEPIYWLVALREDERQNYVRIGESSYYSGLYVDQQGLLQKVCPSIGPSSLVPLCKCCTHTFNGMRFTQPFVGLRSTVDPSSLTSL